MSTENNANAHSPRSSTTKPRQSSATTAFLNSGMQEATVRQITGHKNLDVFMGYYKPNADELNKEFSHFERYRAGAESANAKQSALELVN